MKIPEIDQIIHLAGAQLECLKALQESNRTEIKNLKNLWTGGIFLVLAFQLIIFIAVLLK
jgi:hypothetical protein